MLPKLDTITIARDSRNLATLSRNARAKFLTDYAEHRKEADAYARVPNNPLSAIHREREEKLKSAALATIAEHPTKIAELRAGLTAAKRQLDLKALLHEGGRFRPAKEDSDIRELLNFALQDRYAARFRAMSGDEQRDEIESLTARLDYNNPHPEVAAKLATIDLTRPTGLAQSALITAFSTLESRWKNRSDMVQQIEQAEADLRAAEAYADNIARPQMPLAVAAQMDQAEQHGHLTRAA